MHATRSKARRPKGFTLIELMIVVAVIAILAIIAIPQYVEHVRKGKRAEAAQSLGDLELRQERFRADNPTYATTMDALTGNAANTTAYNGALKYFTVSVTSADATGYVITATRKGDLANDPRCANFVIRSGTKCDTTAAVGTINKCMSDNANVDYCWRQ